MDVSLLLPFEEISAAIASVPAIKLANLEPQSIEFMERDIVESSAEFTGNPVFPTRVNGRDVGAYILVTLVGGNEAELTAKMDRLAEVAERAGAFDVLVVWTDNLKKDVWAARSAFLTAIEADSKLLDEMDVVVPVDRIAEFLAFARAEAEKISALRALCEKLTPANMAGDNFERAIAKSLPRTGVWRIQMEEVSGKEKPRP